MKFIYSADGEMIGFTYQNKAYYYIKNIQGDVMAIADSYGTIIAYYMYDAWGNPTPCDDCGDPTTDADEISVINPIRYRGYYYDSETGLYYLQSRYYNPEWGRFVNADTTTALINDANQYNKNLFAYCDSNPNVRLDLGGDIWETVFDVVSLGFSIAEVAANPYDISAWVGLVGDTIDIIPIVTGVGETVRGLRFVDKVGNTLEIAKATDLTKDAKKMVNSLKKVGGFTKSTKGLGIKIHKGYKATANFPMFGKEYRGVTGIRPDYVDFSTKTIFELKPMNPRSAKSGIRQLQRYNNALGGSYNLRLDLYGGVYND